MKMKKYYGKGYSAVMLLMLMATACANYAGFLGNIIGGGTGTGTGEDTVLAPIAMLLENPPEGDLYIEKPDITLTFAPYEIQPEIIEAAPMLTTAIGTCEPFGSGGKWECRFLAGTLKEENMIKGEAIA